jgi:preprotein translocase subunit SecB
MDKPLAKIQFKNYIIKDMQFKLNQNYVQDPDESEVDLDISLSHKLALDSDEGKAELTLISQIAKDFEQNNQPFSLLVEITGIFLYDINLEYDKQVQMLLTNGSAILFPYLRASISMVTMLSGIPPFILPTLNIKKIMENNTENQE